MEILKLNDESMLLNVFHIQTVVESQEYGKRTYIWPVGIYLKISVDHFLLMKILDG